VYEFIGKLYRKQSAVLHSQFYSATDFTNTMNQKSFISTQLPLRQWCDCVRVEKRHKKDKTGKFVSANLDFGATRRFSIVICAPLTKGFSLIFLTVKKEKKRES
jgi:regulation of enolase protein 1 (concanavalin A-like superfamily)